MATAQQPFAGMVVPPRRRQGPAAPPAAAPMLLKSACRLACLAEGARLSFLRAGSADIEADFGGRSVWALQGSQFGLQR